MTKTALDVLNILEDSDNNPPPKIKRITLQAAIAYAEQNGYRWLIFGDCFIRKDETGQWKGSVAK